MAARKQRKNAPDPAAEAFDAGHRMVWEHPLFTGMLDNAHVVRRSGAGVAADGWATVSADGYVHVHATRRQTSEEWAYVLATALLHLGFDHFSKDRPYGPVLWSAACSATVARFLRDLKFGKPPFPERGQLLIAELPLRDERAWFAWFEREGLPDVFADISVAGPAGQPAGAGAAGPVSLKDATNWPGLLADGVRESARLAVEVASGSRDQLAGRRRTSSRLERAREWVMSSYPLLGGLAAHFDLIEDAELSGAWTSASPR